VTGGQRDIAARLRRVAAPSDWAVAAGIAVVTGIVLAVLSSRVSDWAVMTDELLYERLAISFADGALVPTVHGERADVYAVLYPLLLAPVFGIVELPDAVRVAHGVNGVLFASASVPVFLLARELALPRLVAAAAAVFSVAIPWTVIGGFVMTEAAAYPAAVWALLAIQRAVVLPSPRRDLVALGAIAVAVLARPQLAALGLVLVLAAVAQELRFGRWRLHAVAFGVALLAVPILLLGGSGLLGSYAPALEEGGIVSWDALRLALIHVNVTAVALGIVPLVLGGGWAVAALVTRPPAPDRLAFAAIVTTTTVVLAVESGSVVERFGLGLAVKDRYFFYVAPLLFLATACALEDRLRVVGLVGVGALFVATVSLEEFEPVFGINIDSPAASTHEALTRFGNNVGLTPAELLAIAAGVAVVALFFALRRVPRGPLTAVVLGGVLAFAVAESAYTWDRLFASSGPSGRPLTTAQSAQLSWIDEAIPSGSVGMLPYSVGQDWYPSAGAFWDLEFWNKRVERAYMRGGYFTYTPATFPRRQLEVDPRSGMIATPAPDYVARTTLDARLRPAGITAAVAPEFEVVDLEVPFRAAWMTLGLDPDGWTRSRRRAFLRVFPPAGAVVVTMSLSAPEVGEPLGVTVGPISVELGPTETREIALEICVPADGYEDVEITTSHVTTVRAVATNPPYESRYRNVGVRLSRIETAPTGAPC
jgi:hypothetical protein